MIRELSDQELAELKTSKSMTPLQRLNWLAVALDFTRSIEQKKPLKKSNKRK